MDRRFPDIFYVPEDAVFIVCDGTIAWRHGDRDERSDAAHGRHLCSARTAFASGLEKQAGGSAWRLVGARPRGTLCHKPCTVSGGGKSEISKSIANAVLKGPVFVSDYHHDMDQVAEIFERDFSGIYTRPRFRTRGPAGRS